MEEYGAQMAVECWDISGASLAAGERAMKEP